jgi:hypothetical protein
MREEDQLAPGAPGRVGTPNRASVARPSGVKWERSPERSPTPRIAVGSAHPVMGLSLGVFRLTSPRSGTPAGRSASSGTAGMIQGAFSARPLEELELAPPRRTDRANLSYPVGAPIKGPSYGIPTAVAPLRPAFGRGDRDSLDEELPCIACARSICSKDHPGSGCS